MSYSLLIGSFYIKVLLKIARRKQMWRCNVVVFQREQRFKNNNRLQICKSDWWYLEISCPKLWGRRINHFCHALFFLMMGKSHISCGSCSCFQKSPSQCEIHFGSNGCPGKLWNAWRRASTTNPFLKKYSVTEFYWAMLLWQDMTQQSKTQSFRTCGGLDFISGCRPFKPLKSKSV